MEYRDGNNPVITPRKMPGIKKYSNVTLKKGAAANTKIIADYFKSKNSGAAAKRSKVTIEMLDENGKVAMTWILTNAFLVKASVSEAKPADKEIRIEMLEFAHEGMTQKQ